MEVELQAVNAVQSNENAATNGAFDFEHTRKLFVEQIKESLKKVTLDNIEQSFMQTEGGDGDKKLSLDQAFKDHLSQLINSHTSSSEFLALVKLSMKAVNKELCPTTTPVLMLVDIIDTQTIDVCRDVFQYLLDDVETWISEPFYTTGRNYLLRMCNDILKRLSKSQHTVFSGQIQLFLVRLFPPPEKSGVNLQGQFNVENVTEYSHVRDEELAAKDESAISTSIEMEEGEMDEQFNVPIDYNLYRKFWTLQDFFRDPMKVYNRAHWKQMQHNIEEVLRCFSSYKLDEVKRSGKESEEDMYFPKYLTNQKLLDLELSDANFRRAVLFQMLVMFQFLVASVKFKSASHELSEEQRGWVKDTTDRVYDLLKEIPPGGENFADMVKHTLEREENWNQWKNEGCPNFVPDTKPPDKPARPRLRKRSIAEEWKVTEKRLNLGNAELTRLWNICPDNLEACRSSDRVFLPSMEDFFTDAVVQVENPKDVPEREKLVNDGNYGWRALRLLARSSPHFFTYSNQPPKTLPLYLEAMIKKLSKDLPMNLDSSIKTEPETAEEEEEDDEENEEFLKHNDDIPNAREKVDEESERITPEDMSLLASKLGSSWKELAKILKIQDDEIEYLESETTDLAEQAQRMLLIWLENEDEPTPEQLLSPLVEVGHEQAWAEVFGKDDSVVE